jgi:hypothetical protein
MTCSAQGYRAGIGGSGQIRNEPIGVRPNRARRLGTSTMEIVMITTETELRPITRTLMAGVDEFLMYLSLPKSYGTSYG